MSVTTILIGSFVILAVLGFILALRPRPNYTSDTASNRNGTSYERQRSNERYG